MQWPVYEKYKIIYLDSNGNGISYLVNSHDDLLPYSLKSLSVKIFEDFCMALKI